MNGTSLTLGLVAGVALAAAVRRRVGSRALPVDRAVVQTVLARLDDWMRRVMEEAGDNPDENEFDVNEYLFSWDDLEDSLGVPVLGYGGTRVVVRVAPGVVAKLPWREQGVEQNAAEVDNYADADPRVKALLLAPLGMVDGASLYPEVEQLTAKDETAPDYVRAVKAWGKLWQKNVPGTITTDHDTFKNWGRYQGRMVLIDCEPEEG